MTIAGVVSHLRWVEHGWFEVGFLGEPDRGPSTDDDPHAEWRVEDVSLARLIDEYDLGHLDALRELTDGVTGC
jgi:hypothetical protein